MPTQREAIANLKKRLDRIEKKLFNITIQINNSTTTSSVFWNKMTREVRQAYEEARIIFADWSKRNIPLAYDQNLRKQIKKIKQMTYRPPRNVNYNKFKNNRTNMQTKAAVTISAISDYSIGLDSGNKKYNRLIRSTQQLNITESALDRSISKGFNEKRSIYGARKKLQQVLLKDALDKKYIVIIDKNGKPINYNIKSYAEMVARTKIRDGQTEGTINLATAYGSDLVQVSSHNTLTEFDAQFEGKVYSLSGNDPDYPAATFLPPFHPNCIHVITVFFKEALPEKTEKELSDFSKGKIDKPPYKKSFIPLSERKLK